MSFAGSVQAMIVSIRNNRSMTRNYTRFKDKDLTYNVSVQPYSLKEGSPEELNLSNKRNATYIGKEQQKRKVGLMMVLLGAIFFSVYVIKWIYF